MGQETLRTVRLRNGAVEAEGLVSVTMLMLRELEQSNPFAFHDAVMIARDPNYRPFGKVGQTLQGLALLDTSGRMHGSIRAIILSAAEGDGLEMRLRSPLAEAS